MRYEWHLQPRWGKETLHLIWNTDTGEIGGAGAAEIERLITEHEVLGAISAEPIPSAIDASDIRHSREQMAVMLHQGWQLPEELKPFYPIIATPDSGLLPSGVQVIY